MAVLASVALGGCHGKTADTSTSASAPVDNTPIAPPSTPDAFLTYLIKMPPPVRGAYVNAHKDQFQKFYDQADEATKAKLERMKPAP